MYIMSYVMITFVTVCLTIINFSCLKLIVNFFSQSSGVAVQYSTVRTTTIPRADTLMTTNYL